MSRAALRRALQARPSEWTNLAGDVEVRFVEGFPKGRWEFVAGFQDDGHTMSNRDEGSATTLMGAVREAERLLRKA